MIEVIQVEVLDTMFVSSAMEGNGDADGSLAPASIFIHKFIIVVIDVV